MNSPTWEFEAIGTQWHVSIFEDISATRLSEIFREIQGRIAEFDKNYSRFRDDSLVTEMSRTPGEYTLPDDAGKMFNLYEQMFRVTGGLVTPLIGQVLVDAGYDATYSLVQKQMNVPKHWDEVLVYDFPRLTLAEPALLDFGAAGKGYLIDIVGELLEQNGITAYVVDAGGDLRHRNGKNSVTVSFADVAAINPFFRVGLEHPEHLDEVIGVASISNQSLCGSAGNRRRWPVAGHNGSRGTMHHIIDPTKLSSPEHILAVWTIADTTLLADMLTTALFFVSPEVLQKHFQFEYLILNPDHSVQSSRDFPAELFTK